jgi:hypothetical protein
MDPSGKTIFWSITFTAIRNGPTAAGASERAVERCFRKNVGFRAIG